VIIRGCKHLEAHIFSRSGLIMHRQRSYTASGMHSGGTLDYWGYPPMRYTLRWRGLTGRSMARQQPRGSLLSRLRADWFADSVLVCSGQLGGTVRHMHPVHQQSQQKACSTSHLPQMIVIFCCMPFGLQWASDLQCLGMF